MTEFSDPLYYNDDESSNYGYSSGVGNSYSSAEFVGRVGIYSAQNIESAAQDLGKLEIGGHSVKEIAVRSEDGVKIFFAALGHGIMKVFTYTGKFLLGIGKFLGHCFAVVFKIIYNILSVFLK